MAAIQALVACSDLTGYAKFSTRSSDEEVFRFLAEYYEFLGDLIAPAEGRAVKFMGDAALMIFPEHQADAGVRSLLTLQREGNQFLSDRGISSRHHIRAHFGPLQAGEIGTRTDKRWDIIGATVNATFLMRAGEFALSVQAFRKLTPETRKLFKKHTLPVTYIPLTRPHQGEPV